jgi:hypothetical protein
MKITQHTTYTLEHTLGIFVLTFRPYDETIHVGTDPGHRARVIYAIIEEGSENPLNSHLDLGQIYTSHRDHRSEWPRMQAALGLTAEWTMDFDLLPEIDQQLAEESSDPAAYLRARWMDFRKTGQIGNPYRVSLDVLDHSGVTYKVSGMNTFSVSDPMDTARGGALWVPTEESIEEIEALPIDQRRTWCIKRAVDACKAYTAYINGWCYATVVETYRAEDVPTDDQGRTSWVHEDYATNGTYYGHEDLEAALQGLHEEGFPTSE